MSQPAVGAATIVQARSPPNTTRCVNAVSSLSFAVTRLGSRPWKRSGSGLPVTWMKAAPASPRSRMSWYCKGRDVLSVSAAAWTTIDRRTWLSRYSTTTLLAPARYACSVTARASSTCSMRHLIATTWPGWTFTPTRTTSSA